MSRVQSTSSTPRAVPAAPAAVQPAVAPAAAPEESLFGAQQLTAAPTSSLSDVQTRNLVVDATLTATELSLGKEVPLSQNLSAVFAEGVEGVAPTADKIVVTGITLENVYSNVPSRVSVSANLFQNQAQQNSLVNDAGWLYSAASSELAAEASEHVSYAGNDGKFVQLCSLLPMESSRHNECAIYTPTSSSLNSRHLQDYGNISSKDQLWNGIVAVTDSTYYVPAESVVCKVIEKNWDKFGFHPQQEEMVEGSFYRIEKPIVQSVVDSLYSNVIARLPFTDISATGLKLHLQSNVAPSNSKMHNVSMQLKVSYRYPQTTAAE